jgi:protocatechuate 3,4-dioxygenase beta subunit
MSQHDATLPPDPTRQLGAEPAPAPAAARRPATTSRRAFILAALAASVPLVSALGVGAVARQAAPAGAQALPATPACIDDDDDEPTIAQTEGPYFTPNSPERTSLLEPGMAGTKILVSGRVLATSCRPIAGALIDFWQADDAGRYDNVGYTLRGHQFTDDEGRYTLETIVPGVYPGRTRHFHVKVQAPNRPVLTTQLYFPNEPRNARDGIFRPELLMDVQDVEDGQVGRFDFVLNVG